MNEPDAIACGLSDDQLASIVAALRRDDFALVWQPPQFEEMTLQHVHDGVGAVMLVSKPNKPAQWWCGPALPRSDVALEVRRDGQLSTAPLAVFPTGWDAAIAFADYVARLRHLGGGVPRHVVVPVATITAAAQQYLRRREVITRTPPPARRCTPTVHKGGGRTMATNVATRPFGLTRTKPPEGRYFRLGRPFGRVEPDASKPSGPDTRPYGLRYASDPAPAAELDVTAIGYDAQGQVALVHGEPIRYWDPTYRNQETLTNYNGSDNALVED